MGIDAPTPAREKGLQPYGALYCFEWRPKVSKGERREAGIQWIQPPKAVSDRSFRQTTSGAHGSANRADCLPRGKPFGAPAGADLLPVGSDAPTAARTMGLPPRRGIVLSFGAKESTKESKRHGATEKRLLLPILTAGLAMSRAMELDSLHRGGARSCSPFSAVKMGGPFSLRCLSPLCSPAGGAGQTQIAALGMLRCGWAGFAAQKNRIDFFFCDWRYPYANSVAWDALV